jgi:hypothetical protein
MTRFGDPFNAKTGALAENIRSIVDDGSDAELKALREAVLDAARRGLTARKTPVQRKNPLYVPPSKADAAWLHLYGTARAFVEWASDENIRLACEGLRARDDNQAANIRAVRNCAATFQKLREAIDA